MLRSSMPAVGVHSSAIACGMILDEDIYLDVFLKLDIGRLRCLEG